MRLSPLIPIRDDIGHLDANEEGPTFEAKLPKLRHMSTPQFFYLGLKNSVSKTIFSNMCEPQNNVNFENKESNIFKVQIGAFDIPQLWTSEPEQLGTRRVDAVLLARSKAANTNNPT